MTGYSTEGEEALISSDPVPLQERRDIIAVTPKLGVVLLEPEYLLTAPGAGYVVRR